MPHNTPITELDFFTVKESIKNFLKGQAQFKDYDFDGSNMSVLLDVLAYNTYYNNFYTNMAFSEMFLDSAQLRESIISHAKELNYLPSSVKSSQAKLQVELSVTGDNPPSFITIPKYKKFFGKTGNKTYTFYTDQTYTVLPEDEKYCLPNVFVYEGKVITESFKVRGNETERFILSNENVDISSINVVVRDSENNNSPQRTFNKSENLFGVSETDEVFFIQSADSKRYEVTFGRNIFGVQPDVGNIVDVTYRIASIDEPNGISTFTTDPINGYNVKVSTMQKAEGGSDRESIESIRYFAPKSIQIQDRAVNESDYEIILKNNFPEIQAISVYGGENLNPPQYGRVVISVDVKNSDGVSNNTKEKFKSFISNRTPIGIEPIVISPQFFYLKVDSKVYFNTKRTSSTEAEIRKKVMDAIRKYSLDNLSDFRKTFRFSKFVNTIDDSDINIVSNETSVKAIIEISPELGEISSYDLRFENELNPGVPLNTTSPNVDRDFTISSSQFVYNGNRVYFQDDGKGNIHIVRRKDDSIVYISRNVGTVDYSTGRVRIRNFVTTDYDGSGIRIIARVNGNDIKSPKDRIISIRDQDVNLNIEGIRE